MKIEEIRIPAPWGHIAAKSWGGPSDDYVILVHGYGDNAGAFDGLIPLLPASYKYVAVDIPGYGLSPPFPQTSRFVNVLDVTVVIDIAFDFFGKDKYVLIGHSLGAYCCILYAMIYGDRIEKLVSLDIMGPYPEGPVAHFKNLRNQLKAMEGTQRELSEVSLNYEELVNRVVKKRNFKRETAEAILKRMIRQNEDGKFFVEFDKRFGSVITVDGVRDFVFELYKKRPIRCPFLIIVTENFHVNVAYLDLYRFLKETNAIIHVVEGNHDVHIAFPERVAVKSWNDPKYETVIATHGFRDNAGSFDRLIPLLPRTFHYACVDLPGHGFSSHFDESLPIHYPNYLLAYKRVADHFQKESYVLIGHSFGAQLGLYFAQLFPELVRKVVSLDALYPLPLGADLYMNHVRMTCENYTTVNNDKKSYTYEEVVDKIKNGRMYGSLTTETAEDLVRRMVEKTGDGRYVYITDKRTPIMPAASHEFNVKSFDTVPVKCPVLILLTGNNQYSEANYRLKEHFERLGFNIKYIKGDHHIHQTSPEETAMIVTDFLLDKSKY